MRHAGHHYWNEAVGSCDRYRSVSPRLCSAEGYQGCNICSRFGACDAFGHLPCYCVNERINYLAQVTESPLVQESLAQKGGQRIPTRIINEQ